MADAVNEPTPLARPPAQQDVPRRRFGVAYLALAAILGGAVGLIVVLAAHGGKDSGPPWSAWQPQQNGVKRLDEIARYISQGYALPNGRIVAAVYSTPPVAQEQGQAVPVRAIGVTTGLPGERAADASFYDASSAWAYIICGLSTASERCTIPGKASVARFDLLRREALELALYTFKYEGDVETVVTYMPPASISTGAKANTVLLFRRTDVKSALDAPLAQTLPPAKGSLRPGQMSATTQAAVRQMTDSRLFTYRFGALQDGSPVLVLQPAA
jgi:hypothetical protein